MAISHEVSINQQVSYCIWKIEENEQQMLSSLQLNSVEIEDFERTKVPERRLEWLAARNALKHLLNPHGQFFLIKDHFGKPHLDATTIGVSMSHTKGYGAAALHLEGPVGIDIEHGRQQIGRIAHKFLHESEKLWCDHSTPSLTKIWSAKEALYKLHGRTQLIFAEQLRIEPFELGQGKIFEAPEESSFDLFFDQFKALYICCAY